MQVSISHLGEDHWRAFVDMGRDPATGKWLRATKVVRGTKRDAEDVLRPMLGEADRWDETRSMASVGFHDLCHFHATHLIDAGVPITTVATRLGHRNTATTLNIYAHAVASSDQRAADVIGDALR